MKDGVLKGVLWHQGEGDSNEDNAELYEDRLVALIDTLRAELDVPEAPFIVGTLGDFIHPEPVNGETKRVYPSQIVNEALRHISQRVKYAACVESTGLVPMGDNVHFSSASARELGRRYAEAMIELNYAEE
jgi:hypothetical protein